jgi:hypothetical protein
VAIARRQTVSGRARRTLAIVAAVVVLTAAGRLIDVPRLAGVIKGDEATYVAMALSLAHDGDLKFDAGDLARFERVYRQGPEGIFLKRTYRVTPRLQFAWPPVRLDRVPVPATESLSFAKAFAYPIVAAPFVAIGGLGGMLILNALLLAISIWCAVRFCRERMGQMAGAVLGVAFVVASVVPVFGVFLTSEIFNFTLVLVGYFLWLHRRKGLPESFAGKGQSTPGVVAAAILIGIATYSKPGILAGPLILAGFFQWPRRQFLAVVAALVLTTGGLFALNALVTGEMNYQGGDRKSFYGQYPFTSGVTFDAVGGDMTTNDADTGMVLAAETLRLLPANAWYFLVGRDAGLVPFYFPGIAIAVLWLVHLRRSTLAQWAIALAIAGSIGVLLVYFPFTWNGAGGPPGNRYFLAVYPTMLFLLPSGVGLATSLVALVVGVAFTGAMVVQPFKASSNTWANVARAPLRWLPIELTILDDLPVRLDRRLGRVILVQDPTVFTYAMDPNMYFAEGQAFWIRGGASTDIVLRIDRPLTRLELDLTTRVPNVVTVSFGGRTTRVDMPANGFARVRIAPGPAMDVHSSFPYVLHLTTTDGFVPATTDPGAVDTRNLGVFVRPSFMYGPHGEPLPPPASGTPGGG